MEKSSKDKLDELPSTSKRHDSRKLEAGHHHQLLSGDSLKEKSQLVTAEMWEILEATKLPTHNFPYANSSISSDEGDSDSQSPENLAMPPKDSHERNEKWKRNVEDGRLEKVNGSKAYKAMKSGGIRDNCTGAVNLERASNGRRAKSRDIASLSQPVSGIVGNNLQGEKIRSLINTKKIQRPYERSEDMVILRKDFDKVRSISIKTFKDILTCQFTVKAKKIVGICDSHNYKKCFLMNEANLIKSKMTLDPFSFLQKKLIKKWKDDFIGEEANNDDQDNLKSIVENYVMPWVAPFVYARVTTQDGKPLSLLVGISDMWKLSGNKEEDWLSPCIL